jgi:hypothetical protein
MSIAARVATRYRIVKAFTYAEALSTLGFGPGERPTDAEVQKAYRSRVTEVLRANPEEAADQTALKPLNRAKDVLMGKLEPDRDLGGSPRRNEPGPGGGDPVDFGFPGTNGRPKPEPVKVTFAEAMSEAGVHQVDWKFKTATSYGGYGDTHSSAFVIYGVDGDTHVFVAAQHYTARNMFTGEDIDTWWMLQRKVRGDFRTVAPKVIRDLYQEFPHELKKGYGAKVNMLPEGTRFTEKINHLQLKPIAFKDAVGLLGLVGEDDAWRTNRKRDIRIAIEYGKIGEGDPVVITVNGKEFKLSADVSKALDKKGVLRAIFGTYYSPGSNKVITKMRGGGKPILKALAAVVTSPPELREILEAASAVEAA